MPISTKFLRSGPYKLVVSCPPGARQVNYRTLRRVDRIAMDSEARDDRLCDDMGSGWVFRAGQLVGVSIGYHAEGGLKGVYFPMRHPDTQNFDPEQIYQWTRDHITAGVRFVTQNAYTIGAGCVPKRESKCLTVSAWKRSARSRR